ncbi:hypothetical protein I5I38_20195 [Pseudomonas aeruginosa]|nr:hypothetical protein [Pseudomonas aeruginosa]MBG6533060.1 hypothetical protein [Pseudomonas aeruginosa]MBH4321153.1 hypothetical protein [Pseudomonas aeruginosa]
MATDYTSTLMGKTREYLPQLCFTRWQVWLSRPAERILRPLGVSKPHDHPGCTELEEGCWSLFSTVGVQGGWPRIAVTQRDAASTFVGDIVIHQQYPALALEPKQLLGFDVICPRRDNVTTIF